MNMEAHKKAIRESLEEIMECIQKGVENRQRTIGFHCSVVAADLLELYLHSQNLIDPGASVKHDSFASLKVAKERLKADFLHKDEIFSLMHEIERERNLLCYGKPRPKEEIEKYIHAFNRLRRILEDMGVRYE